jgi:hypothetical protein
MTLAILHLRYCAVLTAAVAVLVLEEHPSLHLRPHQKYLTPYSDPWAAHTSGTCTPSARGLEQG